MNRLAWVLAGSMALAWIADAQAQNTGPTAYPVVQGKTYKFEKIADGVYYATGHYRNGVLLAPITAAVISDLIDGNKTSVEIDDFRLVG